MPKTIYTVCIVMLYVLSVSSTIQNNSASRETKRHETKKRSTQQLNCTVCPQVITQALNDLTADYDNRVRPGFDEDKPTKVHSYYLVTGIGPASEQDMEYTLDIIFRQKWRDKRLAYKDRVHPSIKELRLNSKMVESVWTPDTFFRNGKKSIAHKITVPNRLLRLDPQGNILYTMRLTIKAKCAMILIDFPMDVHTCHLQFGSYAYSEDQLQYDWLARNGSNPVTLAGNSSRLNQFKLINYTWSRNVITTISGNFVVLETRFHLKRQMGYYVIQTYLPCILIVILSQISFWINKEAVPARTVSGIMTVLNLTTLSISTRQSLPKVAYATALDWYMAISFAFCFAALIEFASVNYYQIKIKQLNPGDKKEKFSKPEPSLIQSCAALQERFIELNLGKKRSKYNLNDLIKIASGAPTQRTKGIKHWLRTIAGFFLTLKTNSNNGDADEVRHSNSERQLAADLLSAAEKEINDVATSQGGVSRIDQVARIAFPLAFFFFNGLYWFIYLTHQSHEVAYRLDAKLEY